MQSCVRDAEDLFHAQFLDDDVGSTRLSGVSEDTCKDGTRDPVASKKASLSAPRLSQAVIAMNSAAAEEDECPTEDVSWPAFNDLDTYIRIFQVRVGGGVEVARRSHQ